MTMSRPRPSWHGGLLRYALVGGVSTAVHYVVLALCVELAGWPTYLASGVGVVLGVHYLIAQVVTTLAAMGLTYQANRVWTLS